MVGFPGYFALQGKENVGSEHAVGFDEVTQRIYGGVTHDSIALQKILSG